MNIWFDPKLWICRIEFKLQDLWVGVFWKNTTYQFDVWICLVPCFPLHIGWVHGIRKLSTYDKPHKAKDDSQHPDDRTTSDG